MAELALRKASRPQDDAALLAILSPVVREGLTYPVATDASDAEMLAYWFAPDKQVFVAVDASERLVGTYYIKPNSTGPAAHVANAGFMVLPNSRYKGIGRAMAEHCFAEARRQGYRSMQFNLVIASNAVAVHLWQSVGMDEVGRLPGAFRLPDGTFDDALVMYRLL